MFLMEYPFSIIVVESPRNQWKLRKENTKSIQQIMWIYTDKSKYSPLKAPKINY